METTRCPECGRPAELLDRTVLESTVGPVEHAHVRCVLRHRFWLPVEYLTREPRRPDRSVATTGRRTASTEQCAGPHALPP